MRDTIDMARESWLDTYGLGKDHISFVEALKRFEALVRADERAQRQWVGLTDEDDIDWEEGGNLKDLVKAIETKLKEKNT
jgi:hypothetical protein